MQTTEFKTPRVIALIIMMLLYAIMIPVALTAVLVWYSVTWPWYLWKAVRTAAWPRPFRI